MGRPADSSAKSRRRQMVKRGPWTTNEDTILAEYVKKHGQGNWNAVQKNSGLIGRCGKSCRLRWSNHLRPDLKKGAFTSNEEKLIIQLHANLGNKWARIASQLPGRTDNEIKNFWNTRLKRRQRAGLPIYPQIISMQQQEHHHPVFTSQVPLISPLQNKSLSSNQLFSESSFECSKSGLLGDLLGGSASDHALAKTDNKAFGFGHRIHVNANANSYNHVYEQGVNSTEASDKGSCAIMDDDLMNLLDNFPLSVPIPDWYDEVQHGHGSESSRLTTNGGATQSQPNPVANSTGAANQEYWNFGSRVWNNMFLMLN